MKNYTQSLLDDTASKVAKNNNREFIGERQGKNLYHSDTPDLIIQEFTTNGSEEDKKHPKSSVIDNLRNKISAYLFEYLEGYHIPTHFVRKISDNRMAVKRMEMIPLTVRVYNYSNGALMKKYGFKEDTLLELPVIEHYYDNGARGSAMMNEYHVYALSVATPAEFKQINRIASKVNAVLRGLCDRRQLMLAEIQLGFGRYKNQVLLGDELTPFTCRFLDVSAADKSGRERFVPGNEMSEDPFSELCERLMLKV